MKSGYKVTKNGRELLMALAESGKGLEITRVTVGKGKVPEDTNLADMTGLKEYVAEGTIAQRRHVGNTLYLTVQYSSNDTPGLAAFWLDEFDIWAKHPVTGVNTAIAYATLGDEPQFVKAYNADEEPDVRQYPLSLVLSDEINVTISCPAGLVTYADLQSAVEAAAAPLVGPASDVDKLQPGGILFITDNQSAEALYRESVTRLVAEAVDQVVDGTAAEEGGAGG